jgi:hypothetical protein
MEAPRAESAPLAENLSVILTHKFLGMIRESGASQMEAYAALNAAKALVSCIGSSHVPSDFS